jgi:hypothetical protein
LRPKDLFGLAAVSMWKDTPIFASLVGMSRQ